MMEDDGSLYPVIYPKHPIMTSKTEADEKSNQCSLKMTEAVGNHSHVSVLVFVPDRLRLYCGGM